MRLVHGALQRLGARHLPAADRRRPTPQEAGRRGPGPQDSGALLGDVARQETLARPADWAETAAAAVETASPGRGAAASPREDAGSANADRCVTQTVCDTDVSRTPDSRTCPPRSYVLGTD